MALLSSSISMIRRKDTSVGKTLNYPLRVFTPSKEQELHQVAHATSERLDAVKRARALLSVQARRPFDFCSPGNRIQKRGQLCWLRVSSLILNEPVRTPHAVSCSLPIPKRKSTILSMHLLIFFKGERLLCRGFSPSSRACYAFVFSRSTIASSLGPNRTPHRCCS